MSSAERQGHCFPPLLLFIFFLYENTLSFSTGRLIQAGRCRRLDALNIFDVPLWVATLRRARETQHPGEPRRDGQRLPLPTNEPVPCRNFGSAEAAGGRSHASLGCESFQMVEELVFPLSFKRIAKSAGLFFHRTSNSLFSSLTLTFLHLL